MIIKAWGSPSKEKVAIITAGWNQPMTGYISFASRLSRDHVPDPVIFLSRYPTWLTCIASKPASSEHCHVVDNHSLRLEFDVFTCSFSCSFNFLFLGLA